MPFRSPSPYSVGLNPDGTNKRVPEASKNHRLLWAPETTFLTPHDGQKALMRPPPHTL